MNSARDDGRRIWEDGWDARGLKIVDTGGKTIIILSGWWRDAGDILFKIQSRNSSLQVDR